MESSTAASPHPFRYIAQKPNVRDGVGNAILPGQEYVGAELLRNVDWLCARGFLLRVPRGEAPAAAASVSVAPAPAPQSPPPGPAVASLPPQIQKPNRR